jgi:formyl-CoA transferase
MLPLAGIRVVEWTTAIAGPYGGMLFADLGAEVIKIEGMRGATNRLVADVEPVIVAHGRNRPKYITINLRTEGGREVIQRLARTADIFYENRLPGSAKRIHCSYEELAAVNPRIIVASIKGYQEGPYGHRPGNDPQTETDSGFIQPQGVKDFAHPPVRVGTPSIDITGAQLVVVGAMIALMNREKTGRGDHITTSLYEDNVSIMSHHIIYQSLYGRTMDRAGSGAGAARFYQTRPETVLGRTLGSQRIRRWVYIDVSSDERWKRFCTTFEVTVPDSVNLTTEGSRAKNQDQVEEIMDAAIAKVSVDEFMAKLEEAGMSGYGAPVYTDADVLIDPHLLATKSLVALPTHPEVTRRWYRRTSVGIMLPFRASYYNPNLKSWGGKPIRRVGEDTVDVLRDLGYTEAKIQELLKDKAIYQAKEEK